MPIRKFTKAIKKAGKKAEESLSPVVKSTTEAVGSAAKKVEEVIDDPKAALDSIEESAKKLIEEGKQAASSISEEAERMATEPEKTFKTAKEGAAKAAKDFGRGVDSAASDIADGARGALLKDADYTFYQRANYYQASYIENLIRTRPVLDTIVIIGESLTQFLTSGIHDPQIIEAYELAYPNLAAEVSLQDRVAELSDEQLVGLINGIKGKLFETQYVELLNSSLLPEGATASLAEKANEPGWDIQILDANGMELEILQAKATSSVYYVQSALDKYPNIDVVTTEETFQQLVEMGQAEGVISSGISNADLQGSVEESLSGIDGLGIVGLPAITLAIVAFTSYNNMGQFDVKDFTHRSCQAYIAYLISIGAMSATGMWLLGPVASIVSMGVMHKYTQKYRDLDSLKTRFGKNEAYIQGIEAKQS
ncbi:hypothetical protein AB4342_18525 [Vibrio breoganii]|uniref:hypothetical protein n=1 Tax=Vibrio breoganii TaxID=553239 RepID=UPI000C849359|nr:hypothetical protein [Vibrio breoganii]PMJ45312.1 hypothetical protein BCU21_13620 [Vibrio breoganii]PMK59426.1 hypothetical protein BCT97_06460 [Vibrio breoganii]PMM79080.1 hypothetical protein BCT45_17035 [Vibrio breoganii]PMO29225.1 hypothetical protein BCT14_06635 [Vibrio breoganii]PMO32939.1 hypothetical protein BCT13_08560 [Vibrio breoganii]